MGTAVRDLTLKPLADQRLSTYSPGTRPRLPRAALPPSRLTFGVFHGRVQEVLIAQNPFVHGQGRSFAGFGSSHVTTELIKETSVWLKDSQIGQERRFDLGETDLPMRAGHDVTFLWVNLQLYAIHNHSTGETKYFELPLAVAPFRKVRFRGFAGVVWVLLGVPLLGVTILPLVLGMCAYPLLAALGRADLWTAKVLDPYIAMAIPPIIAALIVVSGALMFLHNKNAHAYNWALHQELERQIGDAMARYVFAYPIGRPI